MPSPGPTTQTLTGEVHTRMIIMPSAPSRPAAMSDQAENTAQPAHHAMMTQI